MPLTDRDMVRPIGGLRIRRNDAFAPIGWWLADGYKPVDITDSHTAVAVGSSAPTRSSSPWGPCFAYAGTSTSNFTLGYGITTIPRAQGSLSVWAYSTVNYGTTVGILGGYYGAKDEFGFYCTATSPKFEFGWYVNSVDYRTQISITSANFCYQNWAQYALTWVNGGSCVLYRNGISLGSSSSISTATTNAGAIYLGQVFGGSAYWHGYLDDVRLYDYALTPSQVQAEYSDRWWRLRGRRTYALPLSSAAHMSMPYQLFFPQTVGF